MNVTKTYQVQDVLADKLFQRIVRYINYTKPQAGPTVTRPTLTADDVGIMYMDTSLAANGLPIWWNGSAWVNYNGTVV